MFSAITKFFANRPTQTLTEQYDRAANKWHTSIKKNGHLTAYADLIRQAAPKLPTNHNGQPLQILDAGAGSGAFSLAFCHVVSKPVEIDLLDMSDAMLATAERNHKDMGRSTNQICADIAALDPNDKRYDVILCAHTIEHCLDPVAALEKLRAVLNPGGIVLLAVSKPHWCTVLVQFTWRHKAYRITKFLEILSKASFASVETFGFTAGPPKFLSYGYIATPNLQTT